MNNLINMKITLTRNNQDQSVFWMIRDDARIIDIKFMLEYYGYEIKNINFRRV